MENHLYHPKFNKLSEFISGLFDTMSIAWKNRKGLAEQTPLFRETISLTVTFANNCRF